MGNDLFEGLGGLGGGLGGALGGLVGGLAKSGLVPQDDPAFKLLNAQQELTGLQKQESELLAEVGRKVMGSAGAADYPQEADKLKLIRSNIISAQQTVDAMQSEQKAKEEAEKQAVNARTCPSCGHENPEGVNFCQECGTKLGGTAKAFCPSCGAENAPGTRFCGSCGARMGE
ncbi:MAG: zinc ribbon domain-containing protein [Clostridiales Family XIII bacterium]|jgi:ribosomal protein L40E|nr:zinc ribbon domain-containing protein [Clostridiales Family XIII bacterium]